MNEKTDNHNAVTAAELETLIFNAYHRGADWMRENGPESWPYINKAGRDYADKVVSHLRPLLCRAPASQEAPASPAAAHKCPDCGTVGDAKKDCWCQRPASPSPGLREAVTLSKACPCAQHSVELTVPSWLREAVIEECAKVAETGKPEWEGSLTAVVICRDTAAAIRALSRPVSEREDKWCACLKRTVINCDCPEHREPQP